MPTIREKNTLFIENNVDNFTVGVKLLMIFGKDGFTALFLIISFPTSIPSPSYGLGTSTMIGGFLWHIFIYSNDLGFKNHIPEYIRKINVDVSYLEEILFLK